MFGRRTNEPSAPKLAAPQSAATAQPLKSAPAPMKQAASKVAAAAPAAAVRVEVPETKRRHSEEYYDVGFQRSD
jgi:hypothetical protein